ncbi:unnamed protein product [Meloidogyne enterolobii]|uniref:Uncharacterized protein n=1 Tax=Meloidogyne enterolobii TaxID=390850 RepID=A0ACB1B5G6_MELEN
MIVVLFILTKHILLMSYHFLTTLNHIFLHLLDIIEPINMMILQMMVSKIVALFLQTVNAPNSFRALILIWEIKNYFSLII